ncbi:S1 family peptidase [Nonomuraea purpurea]|uniref:S1 family peptidase n=1 Tax=Nonomuraea purpurea TaxID=1849276 RepID=A0ABV8GLV3_9ACTN
MNLQRIIRSLHITTLSLLMVASSAVLWAGATPAQAVKGAGPVADGTYGFVAKVNVGETHSCTGALVSPQWVITATSCFASQGQSVTSGAPKTATTVTVGRTDLSGTGGRVLPVEWIHPHRDRDVVLVKLALRAVGITPAVFGSTVPAAGDALQVVGYGRTAEQWAPNRVHAAPVVAGAVAAGSFGWTGANGSDVSACQGDAGTPVLRTSGDRAELVGLSSGAGQGGCLGAAGDGARGGDAARVDDLASWIRTVAIEPTTSFSQYGGSVTGIGGYDLKDNRDQAVAFDYDHSGKLDHLLLYRPGSQIVFIVKRRTDGTYAPVFSSTTGIGGYDLKDNRDRIIAFDYTGSGKLDHLLLYRPGGKTAWILKHGAGNSFTAVFHSSTGIGGYDLELAKDRIIAFDYRSTGGQSHLFAYRPGDQIAYFAGRALPPVRVVPVTVTPVIGPDSIVERFAYPAHFPHEYAGTSGQTDWGTEKAEEKNFELISGNGGIIWVSCSSSPENGVGVLKVFPGLLNGQPVVGEPHLGVMAVCFKVLAPTGWVKLRIPNVFEVQGDSRSPGAGHDVDATVVNVETGTERTKLVERDESEQFGRSDATTCDASHPDYPQNCSETLLELRVVG